MASIKLDKATGKWRAQVYVGGTRGSKSFRLKAEAQEWAQQQERDLRDGPKSDITLAPDGHFKFPHLWPVKLLHAGRADYEASAVTAMRAAASLRR